MSILRREFQVLLSCSYFLSPISKALLQGCLCITLQFKGESKLPFCLLLAFSIFCQRNHHPHRGADSLPYKNNMTRPSLIPPIHLLQLKFNGHNQKLIVVRGVSLFPYTTGFPQGHRNCLSHKSEHNGRSFSPTTWLQNAAAEGWPK